MKTNMKDELQRAARELDLRIVAPFRIKLPSGIELNAEALLPEVGAPNGTVVVTSSSASSAISRELRQLNYTMSSFGEPLEGQPFDVNSYRDMFKEWGWYSTQRQAPNWFVE